MDNDTDVFIDVLRRRDRFGFTQLVLGRRRTI